MKAARRLSTLKKPRFVFLASDGWGKQSQVVAGIEEFAVGAITVELESKKIQGFDDYMNTLTPATNGHNPWFSDYWETMFECSVDGAASADWGGRHRKRQQWLGGPGGGRSWYKDGNGSGGDERQRLMMMQAQNNVFRKPCDPRLR